MSGADAATLTIRAARVDDAAAIARLSGALGYPADANVMESRLIAVLASGRHAVFVAEARDGTAGWLCIERRITLEGGESFEITGLVVDSLHRRVGAGRCLVARAAEWARAQGGASIMVRSSVAREASHAFYASLGFDRSKTQHIYRRPLQV